MYLFNYYTDYSIPNNLFDKLKLNLEQLWNLVKYYGPEKDNWSLLRKMDFINYFGYHYPTEYEIDKIVKFVDNDKVISIGTGVSFIERLLLENNIDIKASDSKENNDIWMETNKDYATTSILNNKDHNAMMLCWPPYNTSMALNALLSFKGDKVIYIGENYEGYVDIKFYNHLNENYKIEFIKGINWKNTDSSVHLATKIK